MSTLTHTQELTVLDCWCGMPHAIPTRLYNEARKRSSVTVYCPLGHTYGWHESEADRLRKRLESAERRENATRDLLDHEQRSHAATRGHLTRVKKRVAHGVCPHCTRKFTNLERHMQSKHPEQCGEQA